MARILSDAIFGPCGVAEAVEQGLKSSHTPEQWHDLCHGIAGGLRCACPCHDGEDLEQRCSECGDKGPTPKIGGKCVDQVACRRRKREHYLSTEAGQRIEALFAAAREERGERRLQLAESRAADPHAPRPKTGRCEWSGDTTKGGKFLPGNDAKLKGALLELAKTWETWPEDEERNLPVEAWTELHARKWIKLEKVPLALRTHVEKLSTQTFVDSRIRERYERLDRGEPPVWQP